MRYVLLVVCGFAVVFIMDGFTFRSEKEYLCQEAKEAFHAWGKQAVEKSIELAGPCLDECGKFGLSVRKSEFVLRTGKVHDAHKPPAEWESPELLLKDILDVYLIVLTKRERPLGAVLITDALSISRKDLDFKRAEKLYVLLAGFGQLLDAVKHAENRSELMLQQQRFKEIQRGLREDLGPLRCDKPRPPEVQLPCERKKTIWC